MVLDANYAYSLNQMLKCGSSSPTWTLGKTLKSKKTSFKEIFAEVESYTSGNNILLEDMATQVESNCNEDSSEESSWSSEEKRRKQ